MCGHIIKAEHGFHSTAFSRPARPERGRIRSIINTCKYNSCLLKVLFCLFSLNQQIDESSWFDGRSMLQFPLLCTFVTGDDIVPRPKYFNYREINIIPELSRRYNLRRPGTKQRQALNRFLSYKTPVPHRITFQNARPRTGPFESHAHPDAQLLHCALHLPGFQRPYPQLQSELHVAILRPPM
jgi:hypothetical protein